MLHETEADRARMLPRIDHLISNCYAREAWTEAAALAELCAEAEDRNPRHWNNLGLFLRYQADEAKKDETLLPAVMTALAERSLEAYERALELAPDDPGLVNDTAVLLHYYLDRDLERAGEMYLRAAELARAKLSAEELPEDERASLEKVVADATANTAALAGGPTPEDAPGGDSGAQDGDAPPPGE